MSAPFHRSLRALVADRARRPIQVLVVAVLLCGLWSAWFFLFRVSVYAVSSEARVEVEVATHPVEPAVEGRVVSSSLVLDRWVEAGEVLVALDARALEIELSAKRVRVESITAQLGPLEREVETKTRALGDHERVARAQIAEARARHRGAMVLADHAQSEAQRSAVLREQALVSAADLAKMVSEGRLQRASAEALEVAVGRVDAESRLRRSEIEAEVAELSREIELLRGQKAQELVAIEALQHEIELRSIRAPISGKLGEIAVLRAGSVVTKGARLGAVVPPGRLQVTADFPPDVVLGRVRPGQAARLRLAGFPWAEYGTLPLSVESVGSEVRNGKVRVELSIAGSGPPAIPMQHGLPGAVEVEVERLLPAELVLRAAGRMLERGWAGDGASR
ncbi:HlyD family secretion protein [Sorangium sp. So ce1078]|uniref:HlyD family secretion protein n=1 Tax=Sorangium sp. So ce1078 TaxID=3133329 RepID=UPI003F608AB0